MTTQNTETKAYLFGLSDEDATNLATMVRDHGMEREHFGLEVTVDYEDLADRLLPEGDPALTEKEASFVLQAVATQIMRSREELAKIGDDVAHYQERSFMRRLQSLHDGVIGDVVQKFPHIQTVPDEDVQKALGDDHLDFLEVDE